MHIEIFGLDKYVVANLSLELQKPIINLTKIDENDLFFSVHETLTFHVGVDQNAWHTRIKITMPELLWVHQASLRSLLTKALQQHTIHLHFEFILQKPEHTYSHIQKDYPLFVSESNQVTIDKDENQEVGDDTEIYHGNIFAGKESDLENLDNSEATLKTKKKKVA